MLNFTKLLYKEIGARIKEIRKSYNKALMPFCYEILNTELDQALLSKIERGINDKRMNPYLLSAKSIQILSSSTKIKPSELIWGDSLKKENFIKMIILGILLNSENDNPFENYDFNDNDLENWYDSEADYISYLKSEKERLTTYDKLNYLKNKYGCFLNQENYQKYELLKNKSDPQYKKISNFILKLIMTDIEFSNSFIRRFLNTGNQIVSLLHSESKEEIMKSYIFEFLSNHSEDISDLILDYKTKDYHLKSLHNF